MPIYSTIEQPSKPEKQVTGQAVSATLRRPKMGREILVEDPEVSTGPITIKGNSRITFVLEAADGKFDLDLCYGPVFNGNSVDEGASKWVNIGTATVVPSNPKVKQTFEDIGYAYRLVRTSGTGNFLVYDWQMP